MIETAVLFRGRHASLYRDEVEKFLAESAADGEIGEVGRFDLDSIPAGDPDLRRALSDDSFWIDDTSAVLLDNVQAWSSDDLGALFTELRGQGTRYTLALVHREGGAPSKKLLDVATEPIRDYRVPTKEQELVPWFTEALRSRGVELTSGTARKAM